MSTLIIRTEKQDRAAALAAIPAGWAKVPRNSVRRASLIREGDMYWDGSPDAGGGGWRPVRIAGQPIRTLVVIRKSAPAPMRIKAFWTVYGARVHRGGQNLPCGEGESWSTAAYWLLHLLEREGYKGEVEFYGPCAQSLKTEFEKYRSIGA